MWVREKLNLKWKQLAVIRLIPRYFGLSLYSVVQLTCQLVFKLICITVRFEILYEHSSKFQLNQLCERPASLTFSFCVFTFFVASISHLNYLNCFFFLFSKSFWLLITFTKSHSTFQCYFHIVFINNFPYDNKMLLLFRSQLEGSTFLCTVVKQNFFSGWALHWPTYSLTISCALISTTLLVIAIRIH